MELRKQTNLDFLYDYNAVKSLSVDLKATDKELTQLLDEMLPELGLEYYIEDKIVVIRTKVEKTAYPQNVREHLVQGQVTDEAGRPVPGVTVILKGSTIGTATDNEGRYRLPLATVKGSVLVFTFVGMETQEITLNESLLVNVRMREAQSELADVVVTGYQTISRERAGGAYTTINEETLGKKPVFNISNALRGLVPGMVEVQNSTEGQSRFIIRGEGTLQTTQEDKDPLIVVDGFPIQGFTPTSQGGYGLLNAKDPFASINPNDVESITVLKDAAATSIYGARAANGVIVITTKKGKRSDKVNISANGFFSVSSMPDLEYAKNMASTESVFELLEVLRKYDPSYKSAWYNPHTYSVDHFTYINEPASLLLELELGNITEAEFNSKKAELIGRNQWKRDLEKYVYRNASHQQYNIALRGGTEKMTYSFSVSYDSDKAMLQGDENSRIRLNLQNSFKLYNKLTLGIGINANIAKSKNNAVNPIANMGPWSRLVDEKGNFVHLPNGASTMYYPILMDEYEGKTPVSWQYNPIADREQMSNKSKRFGTRFSADLTWQVIDPLSVSVKGQYERNHYTTRKLYRPESYYVRNYTNRYSQLNATTGLYETYMPSGGIFVDNGDTYEGYNLRAQANFNKRFDKHEVIALVGTEVLSSTTIKDPTNTRYGYNENTNAVLSTVDYVTQQKNIFGTTTRMPYAGPGGLVTVEDRFFSVYANASYTYDSRYSVHLSARTDASNFQAKSARDKFSPFWSASAVWLLSREGFMTNVEWVDLLKVRFSAGESGIAAGKSGQSAVTTLSVNTGSLIYSNNEPYNAISTRGNPTLTWEKSRNFDFGVEFNLWQSRLSGSITYYNRYSYDVLSSASVPIIAQGVTSSTFNNAAISNNGVEIALGSRLKAGELEWNGNLNFSYNKNTLRRYNVINTGIRPSYYVGYPIRQEWTYKLTGYTPEGYIILQGKDGTDELVTSRDATHLYDAINGAAGEKVEDYNWTRPIGNGASSCNMGFTSNFSYKGFTFSFLITGKFDYYFSKSVSFSTRLDQASYSKNAETALRILKEGYDKQNKFSVMPLWNDENKDVFATGSTLMYSSNLVASSQANYHKGDHLRLEELYLGYQLPQKFLGEQSALRNVNFFAQAKNLGILWSANGKWDPSYPPGSVKPVTTYTFGLKFNLN